MQSTRGIIKLHRRDVNKWIVGGGLFVLSLLNSSLLIAFLLLVPLAMCAYDKKAGAINAFMLIQCRSVLSSGVAASFSTYASYAKWVAVFGLSFYLLFNGKCPNKIKKIFLYVSFFAIVAAASAILNSSYPTVAVFKIISWLIPFLAICKGICLSDGVDYAKTVAVLSGILVFGSVILLSSPLGYLRNGTGFQGFLNHPNLYGIFSTLFLAAYLSRKKKLDLRTVAVIVATLFLEISSRSRTAVFSAVIVILLFVIIAEDRSSNKLAVLLVLFLFAALLLVIRPELSDEITGFIYKGHLSSIFYSRESQFERSLARFKVSPLLGTGFNVPYRSGVRSYSFSFDLITENGNLVLAVLADCGIIGLLLFSIAYGKLFKAGDRQKAVLFIAPFMISMGEMAFFSTNNIGIFEYVLLALYMAAGKAENTPGIEEALKK